MKGFCPFKEYSDIFGLSGTGVHSYKVLNVIILDNLLTIMAAVFVTYYFEIPFPISIVGMYVSGIIFHMLFGVQTQTLTYLGIKC